MKFNHTKKNIIEIGKDIKGTVCSAVCLVKDVLIVPLSICKDVRDGVVSAKNKQPIDVKVEFKEPETKKEGVENTQMA